MNNKQMLTLIKNDKVNHKKNITDLYTSIAANALQKLSDDTQCLDRENLKKAVYWSIKFINNIEEPKTITRDMVEPKLQLIEVIRIFMKQLTISELMNIFPVTKGYDGDKYCIKDYFYTIESIKKYNPDEPIGDNLDDILFDYQNNDLCMFLVNELSTISSLQRLNNQMTIAEDFCKDNNIKTYTLNEDSKGHQYIIDNTTGRTARVQRKIPRYLKLHQGGSKC